ncbi:MAG: helix-turn-helix domain-containing protein [Parachlamydiales bacterium]|jgi:chromosomal replication initiation ATPase DnaA
MAGDEEFLKKIHSKVDIKKGSNVELGKIVDKICELFGLTLEEMCSSSKQQKISKARAALAYIVRMENHSLESLGIILKRNPSGLSKLASRLEQS